MSRVITIRNIELGSGLPKICIPITGTNKNELLQEIQALRLLNFDLVEWRVDYFQKADDIPTVKATAQVLREALGDIPLLFTLRTAREGGEIAIDDALYLSINKEIVATGNIDIIDVELFSGDTACREIIDSARAHGVVSVVSSHDFQKTPPLPELTSRLTKMRELGGDLPKLAVMPQNPADVLTLLSATEQFSRTADCPIITMSMGQLGKLSRVAGELFGSALTFGTAGRASAPGQLAAEELSLVLGILHDPA